MYSIVQEFIFNYPTADYYYILWIGISFLIYILGHRVYTFENNSTKNYKKSIKESKPEFNSTYNKHILEFEKFILKEKNYLNPNLSLELVAEHLQINKSYLSRIINAELGSSFSDYINQLRVKEAENYLSNSDYNQYTLNAIGLEAGFNSKSVFNSCFKKYSGCTPSEFRRKVNTSFQKNKKENPDGFSF